MMFIGPGDAGSLGLVCERLEQDLPSAPSSIRMQSGLGIAMRRWTIFIVLPIIMTCTAASQPKATRYRWTLTYDFRVDKVNGAPPETPESEHSQQSVCNKAISEPELALILMDGITDSDGCKIEHLRFADGKISFDGACPKDKDGTSYTVAATGTYSDTALHIDVQARGQADGDDLEASGTMIGVRGRTC